MEPLPSSQSLATASSPQSALRYDKLSLWLTAKEQLQALEEKLAQLAAKNSKMKASTEAKHISKECLSFLTRRSSKVKNISSRDVGAVQAEVESSFEVKKTELFHLRERNARLAREVYDTEADLESLKESRAIHQKRLDDVSGKRLEIKCHNSKLRKKNTRLLAEQRKHTYNQIQMKEELELQERELRAAMKTNQNLRREAKRNEVRFFTTVLSPAYPSYPGFLPFSSSCPGAFGMAASVSHKALSSPGRGSSNVGWVSTNFKSKLFFNKYIVQCLKFLLRHSSKTTIL